MSTFINIKNPCQEFWDNMHEVTGGKFCDLCEKKVWDLTHKSQNEIKDLVKEYSGICGRISKSTHVITVGLVLSISYTPMSCSSTKPVETQNVEAAASQIIKIRGKIISAENDNIFNPEIKIITLSKVYPGKIDESLNFEIEIPETELKSRNIVRLNYTKEYLYDPSKKIDDYSNHIVSKTDLISGKEILADHGMLEIGEVVIITPEPPDFFYFNGEKISKNLYEKTKNANPNYQELIFYDEVYTNIITNNAFVDTVYLLYSK